MLLRMWKIKLWRRWISCRVSNRFTFPPILQFFIVSNFAQYDNVNWKVVKENCSACNFEYLSFFFVCLRSWAALKILKIYSSNKLFKHLFIHIFFSSLDNAESFFSYFYATTTKATIQVNEHISVLCVLSWGFVVFTWVVLFTLRSSYTFLMTPLTTVSVEGMIHEVDWILSWTCWGMCP